MMIILVMMIFMRWQLKLKYKENDQHDDDQHQVPHNDNNILQYWFRC